MNTVSLMYPNLLVLFLLIWKHLSLNLCEKELKKKFYFYLHNVISKKKKKKVTIPVPIFWSLFSSPSPLSFQMITLSQPLLGYQQSSYEIQMSHLNPYFLSMCLVMLTSFSCKCCPSGLL